MSFNNKSNLKSTENISNEVLYEIYQGGKSYPKYFIEIAERELSKKNIDLSEMDKYEKPIPSNNIGIVEWIKKNKFFVGLTILTGVASGLVGFFIVISTVLISVNIGSQKIRKKKWKLFNIITLIVNVVLILITYFLFNYLP